MDENLSKGKTKVRTWFWAKTYPPNSTNVAETDVFLCGNFYNFYMDISDELMYIQF